MSVDRELLDELWPFVRDHLPTAPSRMGTAESLEDGLGAVSVAVCGAGPARLGAERLFESPVGEGVLTLGLSSTEVAA